MQKLTLAIDVDHKGTIRISKPGKPATDAGLEVYRVRVRDGVRDLGVLNRDLKARSISELDLVEMAFEQVGASETKAIPLTSKLQEAIGKWAKDHYGSAVENCHSMMMTVFGMDKPEDWDIVGIIPTELDDIPAGTPLMFVFIFGEEGSDINRMHSAISLGEGRCIQKFGELPGLWVADIVDVARWYGRMGNASKVRIGKIIPKHPTG